MFVFIFTIFIDFDEISDEGRLVKAKRASSAAFPQKVWSGRAFHGLSARNQG